MLIIILLKNNCPQVEVIGACVTETVQSSDYRPTVQEIFGLTPSASLSSCSSSSSPTFRERSLSSGGSGKSRSVRSHWPFSRNSHDWSLTHLLPSNNWHNLNIFLITIFSVSNLIYYWTPVPRTTNPVSKSLSVTKSHSYGSSGSSTHLVSLFLKQIYYSFLNESFDLSRPTIVR